MFSGPSDSDTDEMGYAMSRLEIESDLCDAGKGYYGVGSSSSSSHRSSERLGDLDHEISQVTKLKSCPHERFSRQVPGRHQLPVSTVRMLAGRESNFSGRGGRFSSADRCHILSRYLPVKGPWLVDQMDSRAYVSQFSTDGSLFIAGFQGSHIRIYNVEKGWKVQKDILAKSLRWTVTDTSLSPDQRNLVYASMSPIVHIVDVGSGTAESHANVTEIHDGLDFSSEEDGGYSFGIFSVKFSTDGRELVAGSSDDSIYVYDLEANRVSLRTVAHTSDVNTVCFADESGHLILSGGDDNLCKVWDRRCFIGRDKPAGVLVGHLEGVTFIDSRGDGRYFISNGKDQTIKHDNSLTVTDHSIMDFNEISSFFIDHLPLLELCSVLTNLALFLASLLTLSATQILVCVRRGGRDRLSKEDVNLEREANDVSFGTVFKFSLLCCVYVLAVQVLVLVFDGVSVIRGASDWWFALCFPAAQCLAWVVITFLALHLKYKPSEKLPFLLRVWWFVAFSVCLCTLYVDGRRLAVEGWRGGCSSHVVANLAVTPALSFLCFAALRGVSGIEIRLTSSVLQEPLLVEEEAACLKVTPYSTAGLVSLVTLSWLDPLLSAGSKRPLELKDIPLLAPRDRAKSSYKVLKSNWKRSKSENNPSLARAILKSFWKEAACNAVFAGLNTLLSYVGPYMISYFVDYLGGKEIFPHEGYVLAGIFFASKLAETVTTRQWYMGVDILGMHVRSALTAMVYRKGLKLSSIAKQNHTSGEIVNYMAVDVQRIGDYSWYLHDIWMLPMQIVLALAILYKSVGIASVATLVATIISILVTIPLAKVQEEYQDKLMAAKDERMRKTSECLRNMRVLKLQAWEDRYRVRLEEMREEEYGWLRRALYSQAFVTFIFWSSPIFVSAVTFATSIFLGTQLTAGGVLSALATFRILQEPLRNFPDLVSMMAQTKVSLDRISGFLQEEELQEDATVVIPRGNSNVAIEIKDGVFCWDPFSSRPTLSGIQMRVEKGMRVAVCGTVGSGKSSFISCILGEIPKISGEVRICGTTGYVSQSAWIQSGNIEENILFGSPMEKAKYKNVIQACSLKKDLELFSHGDQTIIGERGINLSGGQKQRVQLARALYQDADIYLLDDPFSALDAHTSSDLFRDYILSALAEKTVVFVTHQVEFLPAADLILVMKEGRVIQSGKYDDLLQAGTDFKALVSAHHEAIEAMDIPSPSSEDSDENPILDSLVMHHNSKSDIYENDIETLAKEVQDGGSASDQKAIKEKKKKAKRSRKKQLVQEEERVKGKISMKVYLSYMGAAYKGLLIPLIILAQASFQFLQIASNWWMAWANPQTEGDQSKVDPTVLLVVYTALAFGSAVFIFVRAALVATFGLAAAQKLFLNMLRSVFRAPMSFFDSTPAGRILNRVSIDQSVVDLDIPFRLGGFASTTIQLFGIVGVMTNVTWQVFLLVVPVAVACFWMQKYYMASSRELVRIVSIQKSPIIHLFGESIAGAATIRGFGQEKRFIKRNLYLLDCFARPFFCSIVAIEWLCLRMELLSTLVFAFCMVLLVSFPHGTIDPSMAGLAVTYGLNLNGRLSRWILSFCKLENKIISIERIYQYSQILSEAPAVIEDSQPPSTWPERGTIELLDVKVRYAENLPTVLHGISCVFPGGKKIGIVGRTGSGKSTLIQALFRLIEPTAGRITIDNIDISQIGLHDLRSRLGIIPQDPTLFEGTIRANLDPLEEHSDDKIWEALDKSQLGDVVRGKDLKLDSPVLENGDNWSVGQRQLVSLGRALLKQAKILVLDEATASVDTATDNLIQKIIRTEFEDCTVCTIAHRIPTVIDSDLVLVLSDGRVAEFDTPARLLEDKSSMFLKLVSEYSSRSSGMPDL